MRKRKPIETVDQWEAAVRAIVERLEQRQGLHTSPSEAVEVFLKWHKVARETWFRQLVEERTMALAVTAIAALRTA
jgi:hypothetical protein